MLDANGIGNSCKWTANYVAGEIEQEREHRLSVFVIEPFKVRRHLISFQHDARQQKFCLAQNICAVFFVTIGGSRIIDDRMIKADFQKHYSAINHSAKNYSVVENQIASRMYRFVCMSDTLGFVLLVPLRG